MHVKQAQAQDDNRALTAQVAHEQQLCQQHSDALQAAQQSVTRWQEHCKAIESQHVQRVMGPAAGTLLETSLSAHAIHTALPPRCSHCALVLTVQDQHVLLVVGGMADSAWQSTAFVVCEAHSMLPGRSPGEVLSEAPTVHLAASSDSTPLSRQETAACRIATDSMLVSGGVGPAGQGLELWRGCLHLDTGEGFTFALLHAL